MTKEIKIFSSKHFILVYTEITRFGIKSNKMIEEISELKRKNYKYRVTEKIVSKRTGKIGTYYELKLFKYKAKYAGKLDKGIAKVKKTNTAGYFGWAESYYGKNYHRDKEIKRLEKNIEKIEKSKKLNTTGKWVGNIYYTKDYFENEEINNINRKIKKLKKVTKAN